MKEATMAKMLKKWEKTELPVLNISDTIKNKPNKKLGLFVIGAGYILTNQYAK